MSAKPGDWDYIRPWYQRKLDAPRMAWWMLLATRHNPTLTLCGRLRLAARYFWAYL